MPLDVDDATALAIWLGEHPGPADPGDDGDDDDLPDTDLWVDTGDPVAVGEATDAHA